MEEPKDKRTKEYKEWKKHQKKLQKAIDNDTAYVERGAGDIVEQFTEKTGIKKAVKAVFGDDCGCEERKAKLNKVKGLRTRFKIVGCFTEDTYKTWTNFRKENHGKITYDQQIKIIIPIYTQLFARKFKPLTCCVEPFINDINAVYDKY